MIAAALAGAMALANAYAQTVETRSGPLSSHLGLPTKDAVAKLYDEMDYQRACQAFLWALPMVAMEEARQAHEQNTGAHNGDIALYEGHRNVSVWLTPNVTTPYIGGFINLAEHGPVVLDYPPGATAGVLDDWWDRPVTDLGIPGPDKGQGGKYLFVGPGQQAPAAEGYRVVRSRTFNTFFFFRVLETNPEKAEALKHAVHIYAFSQRDHPPTTRLLTPKQDGDLRLGIQPAGLAYWERLSQAINAEPVEDRDRFFMAMLKPLGIEKGKPFQPDGRQKKILEDAALVGEEMVKALAFDSRFEGIRYRPDANWEYVVVPWFAVDQDVENSTQLDERAGLWYEAFGMSAGSITRTPGVGQTYLGAYRDKFGNAFDGGVAYRLRVPANPPVKLFWSLTLYEAATRIPLQNAQRTADRSSRQDLVKNGDGSVDLYLGPTAPKGFEKNWIPTVPGRAWFAYFRLYGPLQAYFDRSWALPDIEAVK